MNVDYGHKRRLPILKHRRPRRQEAEALKAQKDRLLVSACAKTWVLTVPWGSTLPRVGNIFYTLSPKVGCLRIWIPKGRSLKVGM